MAEGDRGAEHLLRAASAIADAVELEEGRMTAKKRRVVEAAVLCFAEAGYEATATSEIARRAGVAEATIFRHFPTKKDLLVRLVRPLASRVLLPFAEDEAQALLRSADGRFDRFARAVARSRLAFVDRYGPLLRIVVQELPLHPELRALFGEEAFVRAADAAWKIIERFKSEGQIRDLPPVRVFRFMGAQLAGLVLARAVFAGPGWNDEAELDAVIDLALHGLAPRQAG